MSSTHKSIVPRQRSGGNHFSAQNCSSSNNTAKSPKSTQIYRGLGAFPEKCSRCGSENLEIRPTSNLHAAEIWCGGCKKHVKWLSKQDAALAGIVPSVKKDDSGYVQTDLFGGLA